MRGRVNGSTQRRATFQIKTPPRYLYDRDKACAAKWDETGEILYVRGRINAMLGVEAIRTAQEKFGKKPLTGEQVR